MTLARSAVAAGAVLVAVGAVLVAGSEHPRPVQVTAQPQRQAIGAQRLSCPGAPGTSAPTTTVFAVGRPATASSSGPSGRLIVTSAADRTGLASARDPAQPLRLQIAAPESTGGILVDAVGPAAPGLTAAQFSTYRGPRATGLAAAWCVAPRSSWWFTGVDTSVGTSTSLILTNPSPAVAVVDLGLIGGEGRVDAAGSSGIVIPARSRRVLDLARYAPGQVALTLQVVATRGTIGADVSTTLLDGLTPVGAEWVPPSAPPAESVVVNATLGVAGTKLLTITNPGNRQQVVSVRILDSSGGFSSTRLPEVQVPPGSTVTTGVRAIVRSRPTAIELRADHPITGSLTSGRVDGRVDFAVTGTTGPLTSPAVVPLVDATTLSLSFATSSPGTREVEVRGLSARGIVVGRATLRVNGSATTSWRPPSWGASYLVVTVPSRSDLHAVASYASRSGVTQLPLFSAPVSVVRPAVLPF